MLAGMTRILWRYRLTKVPTLKIQLPFGSQEDSVSDLEQSKCRFNFDSEVAVVAEGRVIKSFNELIGIAKREDVKGKGFVEMKLFSLFSGV
jgi:hypothetical protein